MEFNGSNGTKLVGMVNESRKAWKWDKGQVLITRNHEKIAISVSRRQSWSNLPFSFQTSFYIYIWFSHKKWKLCAIWDKTIPPQKHQICDWNLKIPNKMWETGRTKENSHSPPYFQTFNSNLLQFASIEHQVNCLHTKLYMPIHFKAHI